MKNESGNVLFFILIAVALLGLLTVVVSRSGDSVDQAGSIEQQRVKMSQIMRYAKAIEASIQQLQLNGCSENEISFENATSNLDYTNANSPSDESCHIFEPEGAGLTWNSNLPTLANVVDATDKMSFTADMIVYGVETDTANTGIDLLAIFPVSQTLCSRINTELGVSNTTADITSDADAWNDQFDGGFTGSTYNLGNGVGEAPGVNGERSACIIDDNGDYIFYHVLIAR